MTREELLALIKGDREVSDAIREIMAEREPAIVDAAVGEVTRQLTSGLLRYSVRQEFI